MATYEENLIIIRDNIAAELAAITASGYIRKPTYNIDGQMVDWNGYRDSLTRHLKEYNELIGIGTPFEEISEFYSPP